MPAARRVQARVRRRTARCRESQAWVRDSCRRLERIGKTSNERNAVDPFSADRLRRGETFVARGHESLIGDEQAACRTLGRFATGGEDLRLESCLLQHGLQARAAQLRLTFEPDHARIRARRFLLDAANHVALRQRYRGGVVADERQALRYPRSRMPGGRKLLPPRLAAFNAFRQGNKPQSERI